MNAIVMGLAPEVLLGFIIGVLVVREEELRATALTQVVVFALAVALFAGLGAWLLWWVPEMYSGFASLRTYVFGALIALGIVTFTSTVTVVVCGALNDYLMWRWRGHRRGN